MVYRKSFVRRQLAPVAKPKTQKRRRWSIAAGVRLPGGYGGNIKFNSKRAMYGIAKKAIHSTIAPKKFESGDLAFVTPQNRTLYEYNITQHITKGLEDENRVGERIYLKNLAINGYIDRNNAEGQSGRGTDVKYRILVVKHKTQISHAINTWASAIGASQLFEDYVSNALVMSIPTERDICNVLFDKVYTASGSLNYERNQTDFRINVPLNTSYQYDDNSTNPVAGKYNALYMFLWMDNTAMATSAALPLSGNMKFHLNFVDSK
jgi:hypothetical protein